LAQDTPAMLEITRTIWDGQDYVPYEWDRWLHDASGCLAVAELSGRVVGLVRGFILISEVRGLPAIFMNIC